MNLDEQTIFFRQFATMLSSGLPILKSLGLLKQYARTRRTRELITQLISSHAAGESIAKATSRLKAFPPFIVGMLKAGEAGGSLDVRMNEIAAFLERTNNYRKQLLSKLTYPWLIINFSFFFLPVHHIISGNLNQYFISTASYFAIFYGGAGMLMLIRYFLLQQEGSAAVWGGIILAIPVLGPLMKSMGVQRFLTVYGSLFEAGINVKEALTVAASSTGNAYLVKQIRQTLNLMNTGVSPAQALGSIKLLPDTARHLLITGEATGNSGEMAKKSAQYMETETTAALDRLAAVLPPLVLIIIGAFVGYNLITSYAGYINQFQNLIPK